MELKHFKFWCYKVLPLVYDDSLSYYEVLCKVAEKLNELIDNYSVIGPVITEIQDAINELKEWENSFITSNPLFYNANNENAKALFIDTLGLNFTTPEIDKFSTIRGRNIHDYNSKANILKVVTMNTPLHMYNNNGTFSPESVSGFYQLLASQGADIYGLQEYSNYINIHSDDKETYYDNTPLALPDGIINNSYIPPKHGLFGNKQYLNVSIATLTNLSTIVTYTSYNHNNPGYENGYQHCIYYYAGHSVSYYNTHLAPSQSGKLDIAMLQIAELAETIKNDPAKYVIVTGDFNFEQNITEFNTFFKPLLDCGLSPVNQSINTWPRINPVDMTDNIFYKGLTPSNIKYISDVPKSVSQFDHIGISCEFDLGGV